MIQETHILPAFIIVIALAIVMFWAWMKGFPLKAPERISKEEWEEMAEARAEANKEYENRIKGDE